MGLAKRHAGRGRAGYAVIGRGFTASARRFGLAAALAVLASHPASAIVLSGSGPSMTLSGTIDPGDADAFRAFLAESRPTAGAVLHLHSHGGKVLEAIAIGRLVRRAGLATAVDASRAYCDSACTLIFVAGVRRHYSHGDSVYEGSSGMTGLGFHTAHQPGDRVTANTANVRGSDNMRAFYAEMGVPRAATLIDRAAFNSLFRPSGQTALSLGIATDLAER